MALPSSGMKPPSSKEHSDTGRSLQQEHSQMATPDSPAKMSPARDISDGSGATTKKKLTHADQQPSKAKKMPDLEPTSTPSAKRSDLVDKATDGTPLELDSPHSEGLVSPANKLGSLDNSAGTSSSSENHSQGTGSPGGNYLRGSTALSLTNNVQGDGEFTDPSIPGSRKRKNALLSTGGEVAGRQREKPRGKKLRSFAASSMSTATEKVKTNPANGASKSHESPKSARQSKKNHCPTRASNTTGSSTARKAIESARETQSKVQSQQVLPAYEPPIHRKINALEVVVGANGQATLYREAAPLRNEPNLQLNRFIPVLDLSAMEPFTAIFTTSKSDRTNQLIRNILYLTFTSKECAPALRQWKLECFDDPAMKEPLSLALQGSDRPPWSIEVQELASCAMYYDAIHGKNVTFESEEREAIMTCAKFVLRLFFAVMLITVYMRLVHHAGKFFDTLLNSPIATGITSEARPSWLSLLGLDRKG
ncbi:hypothetical protein MBLNU13_g10907t2 [Cladosporium sp. NU13]